MIRKSFDSDQISLLRVSLDQTIDDRPAPGLMLYKLYDNNSLLGYLIITTAKGRYDYFDYMVIYNPDLSIRMIRVLEYRSEHGYEISNTKWLSQFDGSIGCDLNYGHDIDAISGATLSASSITNDLSVLCKFLGQLEIK